MRVFISWSGEVSHKVAEILYEWLLEMKIPSLELFYSNDTEKGAEWFQELKSKLATADGGIFCMTKDNVTSPWLFFEAGALCVARDEPFMAPFLFRVNRSEIVGPLTQYQHTDFNRDSVRELVFSLKRTWGNERPPKSAQSDLQADFERLYPELEAKLQAIPEKRDEPKKAPSAEEHRRQVIMDIRKQLDSLIE